MPGAVSEKTLHIEGLRELQRAFRVAGQGLTRDLNDALRSAGEPVRQTAESLAVSSIRRIGIPWSRMRLGITHSSVYVAPVQRGDRSGRGVRRRPNLAPLLLERALEPALERELPRVEREVEDALDDMAKAWERV